MGVGVPLSLPYSYTPGHGCRCIYSSTQCVYLIQPSDSSGSGRSHTVTLEDLEVRCMIYNRRKFHTLCITSTC